jgi:predicted permease
MRVPTAATCAILADSMGGEGALTGEIMVMTNLLASITLFCGAMLLKTLGLV